LYYGLIEKRAVISEIRMCGAALVSTLRVDNPIRADPGADDDDCYCDEASDEGNVEDGMKSWAAEAGADRAPHGDNTGAGLVAAVARRVGDAGAMNA
jgi:hypothetical protein